MAKKKASKRRAPKRRLAITPAAMQVLLYLVNNVAIGDYDKCCAVDDLAKTFKKTPGRMTKLIEQLEEQGQVNVGKDMLGTVYPTVAALREQDPTLSESQARAALRKAKA